MIFQYAVAVLEVFVTVFLGFYMFTRGYERRWKNKWARCGEIGLLVLVFVLAAVNLQYYKFSRTVISVGVVVFILGYKLFYKMPLRRCLAVSFLYWPSVGLIQLLMTLISCAYYESGYNIYANVEKQYTVMHTGFQIILMIIICSVFLSLHRRKILDSESRILYLAFILVGILEWYLIVYFQDLAFDFVSWQDVVFHLFVLTAGSGCFVALILRFRYEHIQIEKRRIQADYQLLYKYSKEMFAIYEERKRLVHDFKHHCIAIYGYLNNQQPENAMDYMRSENLIESSVKNSVATGIAIVDFVLNYKIEAAQNENIAVELDIRMHKCMLEPADFCIIMGNLWDNAIEASMRLPEKERYIYCKLENIGDMMHVIMENRYLEISRESTGLFKTAKEDTVNHGIGLTSVEVSVRKYNGEIKYDNDGNTFKVDVLI